MADRNQLESKNTERKSMEATLPN